VTTVIASAHFNASVSYFLDNVGGNQELIIHGKTGILIEPNTSKELLDSINQLYSDQTLKEKIIQDAFITVQNYDWQKIGQQYLNLYISLL